MDFRFCAAAFILTLLGLGCLGASASSNSTPPPPHASPVPPTVLVTAADSTISAVTPLSGSNQLAIRGTQQHGLALVSLIEVRASLGRSRFSLSRRCLQGVLVAYSLATGEAKWTINLSDGPLIRVQRPPHPSSRAPATHTITHNDTNARTPAFIRTQPHMQTDVRHPTGKSALVYAHAHARAHSHFVYCWIATWLGHTVLRQAVAAGLERLANAR